MTTKMIRAIEGTRDYFAEDGARLSLAYTQAEAVFGRYAYKRMHTPVFEATALFARGIGEATDIVEKEMYTFKPGSDTITLRPEGTAGIVRAYLQHNLHKQGDSLTKLWYAGPMFRRERPQKGRQRQFHQVGIEAIGSADPLLDAEVVAMGIDYYASLGITGIRTRLNSIGCDTASCRQAYREKLRETIRPQLDSFCKSCQNRFERNVLRILDCKNPHCKALVKELPRSHEQLCEPCENDFATVKNTLTTLGLNYELDATLVRGLDYYSKTVFEYTHSALGAQDAIGGGGRYDGLIAELGGPATPAVGFALGVERVMIALDALDIAAPTTGIEAFVIGLGEAGHAKAAELIAQIRALGIVAEMDFGGRSLKSQMRTANKRGARAVLILGEDELANGQVTVKEMRKDGGQKAFPLPEAPAAVAQIVG